MYCKTWLALLWLKVFQACWNSIRLFFEIDATLCKIIYFLFFLQRHPIPINAIPCLSYKKALETEEEAVKEKEKNGSIFPAAKVESAEENLKRASLTADEYRDYCQKLFLFKAHSVKKFKSWADRRTHQRQVSQIDIF